MSSSTGCGVANRLLAADLVVGPKYESRADASLSEAVGLGEMTRGVPGTDRFPRVDMSYGNGGSAGNDTTPERMRWRSEKRRYQIVQSVLCLSRRDSRCGAVIVVVGGVTGVGTETDESSFSVVAGGCCSPKKKAATCRAMESSVKDGEVAAECDDSTAWLDGKRESRRVKMVGSGARVQAGCYASAWTGCIRV